MNYYLNLIITVTYNSFFSISNWNHHNSPLHYACGIGNLTNVESLLANEAEVDAHVIFKTYYTIHSQFSLKQDCEGYTSLHIAAGYLNTETVEILLRAGADPEVEDDSGRSVRYLFSS